MNLIRIKIKNYVIKKLPTFFHRNVLDRPPHTDPIPISCTPLACRWGGEEGFMIGDRKGQ